MSYEKNREANDLRKKGLFQEAVVLYRELLSAGPDPFAAAGLLHCLRKQGLFEEALPLCNDIMREYTDSDWCTNEAIWTLVQGKLEKLNDSAGIEETISIAEAILALNPTDNSIRWRVVHRVLKKAKASKKWDLVSTWAYKVNPDQLSEVPMADGQGREGWCDKAIWNNYFIQSLVETGDQETAISLSKKAAEAFPRQDKFFKRLSALASLRIKRLIEAEQIYKDLCSTSRPDWWILHEYANVLREMGKNHEALQLMCKAAVSNKKLDLLVSLFSDMGCLCSELKMYEDARDHLLLSKFIRQAQGWSIPASVCSCISDLNHALEEVSPPIDLKVCLAKCRKFWFNILGVRDNPQIQSMKHKRIRKSLRGKLKLGPTGREYCFISSEGEESFFCFKSDLHQDFNEGQNVIFDAISSFDKKKQRQSWKAVNIRAESFHR